MTGCGSRYLSKTIVSKVGVLEARVLTQARQMLGLALGFEVCKGLALGSGASLLHVILQVEGERFVVLNSHSATIGQER